MKYMNPERIKEIIKKYSTADEFFLIGYESDSTNMRFHDNMINREFISKKNIELYLKSFFESRSASVLISSVEEEEIAKGVALSEELARKAPKDPEYMPQLESADYSFYKDTSEKFEINEGLYCLKKVFENMTQNKLKSYGILNHSQAKLMIMNSSDICHGINSSDFDFSITVKSGDATGWANERSKSFKDLDIAGLCGRASQKALKAKEPKELSPGKYTVILESPAISELLLFMGMHLNEKDVDRGVSCFSGKLNTTVCNKEISLISQIDERYYFRPWSSEGVPARNIEIIKSGVLKELSRSRYYAEKKNKKTNFFGNYVLTGDTKKEKSLEEIIRETQDGILVTRFWYIRSVDPKNLVLTGMTRDGLYQIKDGEISGALKNFRFNESLLKILTNIDLYTKPKNESYDVAAPHVRVNDFTFTSTTSF